MKIIITFLTFMCLFNLEAQNVSIPDINFKNYLLNNSAINTNGDSEIQVSEAAAFSDSIIFFNSGVNDITGIEAFTNLSFLNCALNNISSVDLSQNTQLKAFICPFNNLSTLDVSGNPLLEELVFWENSVSSIDVTMLPQLRRLEFNSNSITSIDLTQNLLLERLYASGNMIGNVDFTIFPNLTSLELNGCGINSIDLSNNPLLTDFEFMINDVTSLDFSQNLLLERMRCDFNEMVTLDLSMCPNLTSFGCFACDNLETVNLQNGSNTNMTNFQINNSASVACVQVDDVAYSVANWTSVDDSGVYSLDCGFSSVGEISLLEMECYPNPVNDLLTITSSEQIERVQLYSEIGRVVLDESTSSMKTIVEMSDLADGVYILHVDFGNGHTEVRRIVKSN